MSKAGEVIQRCSHCDAELLRVIVDKNGKLRHRRTLRYEVYLPEDADKYVKEVEAPIPTMDQFFRGHCPECDHSQIVIYQPTKDEQEERQKRREQRLAEKQTKLVRPIEYHCKVTGYQLHCDCGKSIGWLADENCEGPKFWTPKRASNSRASREEGIVYEDRPEGDQDIPIWKEEMWKGEGFPSNDENPRIYLVFRLKNASPIQEFNPWMGTRRPLPCNELRGNCLNMQCGRLHVFPKAYRVELLRRWILQKNLEEQTKED